MQPATVGTTPRVDGEETRARIQRIALELFTENGYEATSLREIAERLGVTKAALYYHFRTKDDIVASIVSELVGRMAELVEWGRSQPPTRATREEFLRRYSDLLHEQGHHRLMRFFERNQLAMKRHTAGVTMRSRVAEMVELLTDRDAPLTQQLRRGMAIFAIHSQWFFRDADVSPEELRAAALEVGLDLLD
jgi:AcrR family transcriptional regulator